MGQNVLKAASEQYFNYNSNDAENRTREEQSIGPDQMANHNVPMKYIGTLKDRYKYSNDVVTSVVRYCTAALEYKYKQQILSDLQSIRYAQEPENRAENVTDTPHNREIYDYMMRQHMYKTTKLNTKVDKLSDMARGLGTFQMLGFNFLSVGAGMADSITKIIRDGLIGRYYSGKDLARAMGYNTYNLLNYVLNYGKAVPNNKVTAFCHMFGIKGTKEVADQMNNNRAAAVFAQMALGAYSMLDFNTNNVMMHAILTQYRFYDGNAIPKGFYRDYDLQREFIKAGYTKKDAAKARRQCKTSLWSAYKYRNGELYLDPQYEPYVTTKVKNNVRGTLVYRAQVNNGTTPQDGKPRYTESLFGKFIGAMRGWMVSSIQERISGRDDVSVRKYERVAEETVKNGRLSQRISYKILPRTKDQKEARKSWNFNTALPQPEIAKAFTRSLGVMSQTLFQLLSAEKYKARGFSESELFAIKTVSVELGMILSLIQGYQYVDDWCSDVHPINPRKETPYSPAEIYKSKLYKEWVRNGWIRNVNSQIEQYDPTMVYDIVNSISTLSTAVKNMKDVPSYLMTHDVSNIGDQINKDKVNTVKQGKFKGYTQWESTLLKSIGLINNIQTAFTYNGVSTNTAYYARNYSWWMKFMGEEYKPQKSHTSKKKNKSTFELDDLNDDFNEGGSFDSDFSDIDF